MARMVKMLGRFATSGDNQRMDNTPQFYTGKKLPDPLFAKSSIASLLTSALELAKQGKVEIRQDDTFRPIYLRAVERDPVITEGNSLKFLKCRKR